MLRPDPKALLTQAQVVLGPVQEWAGRCYEIAVAFVDHKLVQGVAVYGRYTGDIHHESYFGSRKFHPFVQHGWVLMADGTIVDPTRWAFEAGAPYVAVLPPGATDYGDYDEGGNGWKAVTQPRCPSFDPDEPQHTLSQELLPFAAFRVVEKLIEPDYSEQDPGVFSISQLCWLANAPYDKLQWQASAIYQALDRVGLKALIPIDNWRRAERERAW